MFASSLHVYQAGGGKLITTLSGAETNTWASRGAVWKSLTDGQCVCVRLHFHRSNSIRSQAHAENKTGTTKLNIFRLKWLWWFVAKKWEFDLVSKVLIFLPYFTNVFVVMYKLQEAYWAQMYSGMYKERHQIPITMQLHATAAYFYLPEHLAVYKKNKTKLSWGYIKTYLSSTREQAKLHCRT